MLGGETIFDYRALASAISTLRQTCDVIKEAPQLEGALPQESQNAE
jgi:hypothetical protein